MTAELTALLAAIAAVEKAGPWAIVGLVVAAFWRGDIVLRRELDEMRAQRDEWRAIGRPLVHGLGKAVDIITRDRGGAS